MKHFALALMACLVAMPPAHANPLNALGRAVVGGGRAGADDALMGLGRMSGRGGVLLPDDHIDDLLSTMTANSGYRSVVASAGIGDDFLQSLPNSALLTPDEAAQARLTVADEIYPVLKGVMDDANRLSWESGIDRGDALMRIARHEARRPDPRFTFAPLSGKFTFNDAVVVGGVEITGGSVNIYKLAAAVSGVGYCATSEECIEAGRRLLRQIARKSDFGTASRLLRDRLDAIRFERDTAP